MLPILPYLRKLLQRRGFQCGALLCILGLQQRDVCIHDHLLGYRTNAQLRIDREVSNIDCDVRPYQFRESSFGEGDLVASRDNRGRIVQTVLIRDEFLRYAGVLIDNRYNHAGHCGPGRIRHNASYIAGIHTLCKYCSRGTEHHHR